LCTYFGGKKKPQRRTWPKGKGVPQEHKKKDEEPPGKSSKFLSTLTAEKDKVSEGNSGSPSEKKKSVCRLEKGKREKQGSDQRQKGRGQKTMRERCTTLVGHNRKRREKKNQARRRAKKTWGGGKRHLTDQKKGACPSVKFGRERPPTYDGSVSNQVFGPKGKGDCVMRGSERYQKEKKHPARVPMKKKTSASRQRGGKNKKRERQPQEGRNGTLQGRPTATEEQEGGEVWASEEVLPSKKVENFWERKKKKNTMSQTVDGKNPPPITFSLRLKTTPPPKRGEQGNRARLGKT